MTANNIDKLKHIFMEIFSISEAEVESYRKLNNSKWDSLASVTLVVAICTHAFMRLNLERVSDATHESLKKLVTMLSVIGFQEEGIIEKWFLRDDKWYSKINFGVLRENFLSLQSLRSGKILFENKQELDRAIIEAVKTSK